MIPVSDPIISKNAKKYINEVLESGWISSKGPYVDKFERKFAKSIGSKFAIATNSGTAALHLSLAAINIKRGDEVIVPALTMIAAALPIVYMGATPILVDSDPKSGNIDPAQIEEKITKKTKAIIVVHLNGHPADLDPIISLAKKYNLKIIEDAAESTFAKYKLKGGKIRNVGTIGDIGCFSFYANKVVTTGEGGMAVTNNKPLAARLAALRNLDRSDSMHFFHKTIGFTYRMSSLQAALGLAQLEEVEKYLEIKEKLASFYISELKDVDEITLPYNAGYAKRIYWNFDIFISKSAKKSPKQLQKILANHHIETRNFVIPLNSQPAFLNQGLFKSAIYKVAQDLSKRGITLPLGLTLKSNEVKKICDILKKSLE